MEHEIMEIGSIPNIAIGTSKFADTKSAAPVVQNMSANPAPIQTANAVQPAAAAPSMDQVKQAVESINQSMQSMPRGLQFSIDKDSERVVVKIVDPETKEVIRQIPSEETLAIAKSLDQVVGKLISKKV